MILVDLNKNKVTVIEGSDYSARKARHNFEEERRSELLDDEIKQGGRTMAKTNVAVPRVKLPKEKEKEKLPSEVGKEAMRVATDSAEIFQLMEARDEVQMMQEVMGVYAKEYVYDIPFKGGTVSKCDTPNCPLMKAGTAHTHVRGLSWSGIKEARRIFKAIDTREVSKPVVVDQDGKKFYESSATAVDLRTGNCTTVFKRQPFMKKKRTGEFIEDEFAYEIVQSKAKRNAIAELLPQPLVRGWIQDWIKGKKDFDPTKAIELRKGEGYTVENEETKREQPEKVTGAKTASGPQLTKIYADFRDIEKLGGRSFDASLTEWKKHFGLETLKGLSIFQASKLIKTNIENIAKLKKATTDQERPESQDELASSIENKAKKIQAIKDALKDLNWDADDPLLAGSLLGPYNFSSLADLEKADDATLNAILNDVGARSKEL